MRRPLVAAALAVAVLSPTGAAASPQPSPAPTAVEACDGASEESPLQVEVTTLLPRAPQTAAEPFLVAGRLRNCGDEAAEDLELRLATGARVVSRGELARADAEPEIGTRRRTEPVPGWLTPGQTTPFSVRLTVGDLRLGAIGVYPLSLQARGRYGEDRRRTPLGLATTFVPWFPDGPPAPTRVAWLWPLVDEPRRGPDEVLLSDALAGLVARGGRLADLLAAAEQGAAGRCDDGIPGAPPPVPREAASDQRTAPPATGPGCRGEAVPLTWGVDPALVDSLSAMTGPYDVRVDGEVEQRPPSADAAAFLSGLRRALDGADLLALPFGDPDVTAMARTGGLRDEVEQLRSLGSAQARRLLEADPLDDVAWPPPGPLAPSLDLVAGPDTTAVVLDPAAVPDPAGFLTPSAPVPLTSVTGAVRGLVVDAGLSELVTRRDQGARLAEQRWIVETAILAAELPSRSRTLVLAPPRDAEVDPAVGAAVLADTGRLPWLCPVPLADVVAGREGCAGLTDDQPPAEPQARLGDLPDERGAGLSPAYLDRLSRIRAAAEQLVEAVLVPGEQASATSARLLRATGRAASAAWRDAPLEGDRLLTALQREVVALRRQVQLVGRPVTLTGSSGALELLVQNELDQPVTVGVQLDETSAARLSLSSTEPQTVPPRNATPIRVGVEPRTSGRFVVLATLVDAQGRPFGDPVPLEVRSTQYGRVALAVTGLAAAVLLVAAGVRITRRALRGSRG